MLPTSFWSWSSYKVVAFQHISPGMLNRATIQKHQTKQSRYPPRHIMFVLCLVHRHMSSLIPSRGEVACLWKRLPSTWQSWLKQLMPSICASGQSTEIWNQQLGWFASQQTWNMNEQDASPRKCLSLRTTWCSHRKATWSCSLEFGYGWFWNFLFCLFLLYLMYWTYVSMQMISWCYINLYISCHILYQFM